MKKKIIRLKEKVQNEFKRIKTDRDCAIVIHK